MLNLDKFYIDGEWVPPCNQLRTAEFIDPSKEQAIGNVAMADSDDVDRAVKAAHQAFPSYAKLTLDERLDYVKAIVAVYERRLGDIAEAVSREMGAPLENLSMVAQAPMGLLHFNTALTTAESFEWQKMNGETLIVREPIGVCALITPWNWPLNQIVCKIAPALIAGCTMVLKPSENSPSSAQILTEIIDEAGLPPGVFNLIQGDGAEVGPSLSGHPLVDMVSLTGSHRAGSSVSKHAADTIKRVSLELGGKSANIILQDADLESAVQAGVAGMMLNTGQSCNAPSRMFVHKSQLATVEKMTIDALASVVVGDPLDPQTTMGPIANQRQYLRVQSLIEDGIKQGAKLVAGGVGRPDGIETGFFVKPTIFSEATNDMNIAREEIFGPVLTIIPYESEDEVIKMANDTEYGLSGYVSAGTAERAKEFALQLRTGMVHLNCAPFDINAPFGGYKQSGIGREWGSAGFDEFLETKAIMGS
jgi:acyl-CoA reductase-like NAD-dependent aldehyde dehydrogenase